jgi:hypothetical protein
MAEFSNEIFAPQQKVANLTGLTMPPGRSSLCPTNDKGRDDDRFFS